ncbi:L,D-transpeptidase family protein [Calycomorphotria hydatis]|uniref:L,D-transpeptidase YkuD n=1 Tax=Calycomorphotria hydatis TaxID=2528027 RepID=A0A517T3X1_9PLAN|nr:L,D-transpeptidase family protein [Calycomorphotria hydatis]QDT63072.1 Putative L,D-transpeptidase YkuD [Calycomorphotria hydatis]
MAPRNRRDRNVNTVIWTVALVAFGGLTMWKFEMFPIATRAFDERFAGQDTSQALDDPTAGQPEGVQFSEGSSELKPSPTVATNEPSATVDLAVFEQLEPEIDEPLEVPQKLNLAEELHAETPRERPNWPPQEEVIKPVENVGTAANRSIAISPQTSTSPSELPRKTAEIDFVGGFESEEMKTEPGITRPIRQIGFDVPLPQNDEPARTATPAQVKPIKTTSVTPAPTTKSFFSQPDSVWESNDQPTRVAAVPESPQPPQVENVTLQQLKMLAETHLAAGRTLAAHELLSDLYWSAPAYRAEIHDLIDHTANVLYFTNSTHFVEPYIVEPGDQLGVIARKYQLPWQYLARLNQVDPRKIRPGQPLKVITGPIGAEVSLSEFRLTLFAGPNKHYVRDYSIGIGKSQSTPVGTFKVFLKEPNPKYWGSNGNVIEADDPANPLGEHWICLDDGLGRQSSYGIHGTIDPNSIGKAESDGCIRLLNEDVAEIYDMLAPGSPVVVKR